MTALQRAPLESVGAAVSMISGRGADAARSSGNPRVPQQRIYRRLAAAEGNVEVHGIG
jgi:hypothetical protein